MPEKEYAYGEQFAARYIKTMQYSYTVAKNTLLAEETLIHTPDKGTVLDVGGNVNALLKGNSLRNMLEMLGHQFGKKVHYSVMDISPAYFNVGGVLDEALAQSGVDWYQGTIPGIIGDIQTTELPPQSIDTVIMADTLEHIEDPLAALIHVHNGLKPEGTLELVIPTMYMLDQFPERAKDRKKRTSHVNFYSPDSIYELLNETGFSAEYVRGLDYISGFLYLLYTNNDYIMRRNPKTGKLAKRESMKFKEIQTAIRSAHIDSLSVDSVLNDPENYATFMATVNAGIVHPLTVIHQALTLDPHFYSSEELQNVYEYLKHTVSEIQDDFDRADLINLLHSVPHQFTANSVYIMAHKKTSHE